MRSRRKVSDGKKIEVTVSSGKNEKSIGIEAF